MLIVEIQAFCEGICILILSIVLVLVVSTGRGAEHELGGLEVRVSSGGSICGVEVGSEDGRGAHLDWPYIPLLIYFQIPLGHLPSYIELDRI